VDEIAQLEDSCFEEVAQQIVEEARRQKPMRGYMIGS
jgi:hypothetical protein